MARLLPFLNLNLAVAFGIASECCRKRLFGKEFRRRTNVQQLTCNSDASCSFYYLFFSFVLIELKTFCFEEESPGGKTLKMCEKVRKSVDNSETILPFSCCPLVFL